MKGAYWDTEIKRAQVDGLADYPGLHAQGRTPTSRISRAPGSCCASRDVDLPAVRHAQRRTRSPRCIELARRPRRDFEFQCLHGMGEPLYEHVVGARATGRALPHLRAGRHARDAARLPGAPAARERREHVVRQPDRRRRRRPREPRAETRSPPRPRSHGIAASAHPAAGARSTRTGAIPPASTSPTSTRWRRSSERCRPHRRALRRRAPAGRSRATDGAQRDRCDRPPTPTTSSARSSRRRGADVERALDAAAGPGRAGTRARAERAAILDRAADLIEARGADAAGPCDARGRQDARRTRWARCARPRTSAATTPPQLRRARARGAARHDRRASARGTFRSRSSSARSRRRSRPATRSSPSPPSRRR